MHNSIATTTHAVPSSLLIEAIAAAHGIKSSRKTSKAPSGAWESVRAAYLTSRTAQKEISLSLARNPAIREVTYNRRINITPLNFAINNLLSQQLFYALI